MTKYRKKPIGPKTLNRMSIQQPVPALGAMRPVNGYLEVYTKSGWQIVCLVDVSACKEMAQQMSGDIIK